MAATSVSHGVCDIFLICPPDLSAMQGAIGARVEGVVPSTLSAAVRSIANVVWRSGLPVTLPRREVVRRLLEGIAVDSDLGAIPGSWPHASSKFGPFASRVGPVWAPGSRVCLANIV
jgi:hypothetical protein